MPITIARDVMTFYPLHPDRALPASDVRRFLFDRICTLVQERGVRLGMVFLDGTNMRAHQKAAGAAKRGDLQPTRRREALGHSRGGYGTKACVMADGAGRVIAFLIAPAQAHEPAHAVPLLDWLPGMPEWVVTDHGYSSHYFRQHIQKDGAKLAIPAKSNEAAVRCPAWIYTNRNIVDQLWARPKE